MEHRIIDKQLEKLRDRILLMGGEAENALQSAMRSLVERDSDLARAVLEHDDVIDQLELKIDRMCIEVLALQHPAARDLRFVISVAKITPILERIADHACNIARAAIELNDEPQLKQYVDLPLMEKYASEMLRDALDAFTSGDSEAARRVIATDREIDRIYHKIFGDLLEFMVADPSSTARAAHLLFVSKHIERVGDYVKDICELTVYMTEAAFIKHSPTEV
ncbi:MAG TPA: phosphate signaling complex protein PhoU [Pyrinomonadaceae bacterium]|jgi:phosphate transport system protein|nr:phosphate signaling complex protein PhoU [Pyrinomonadaceae bacterium]